MSDNKKSVETNEKSVETNDIKIKPKNKEWGNREYYGCLIHSYPSFKAMIIGEFGDESEEAKKYGFNLE